MGNNDDSRIFVADRIKELLAMDNFEFTIDYLKFIHRFLFDSVLDNPGEFRTCNLRKKEYILNDDSVRYADYHNIYTYLLYDFYSEEGKKYRLMSEDKVVKNISSFTSRIWSAHPFMDGNTRSVCIFVQKYLHSFLGVF